MTRTSPPRSLFWFSLLLASQFASEGSLLLAQSREDCLACHSDKALTAQKSGKEVSLFVDEAVLNKSAHRKLVCVACHAGFNPDDIPHKPKIEPVQCLSCHKDAAFKHSFHPQLVRAITSKKEPDPNCKDCHGTHDVVSPKVPGSKFHSSNLVESCGACHGDVAQPFNHSAHGKALGANVKGAPNCLTCHRYEITLEGARGDTLSKKIAQEKLCLSCHLDNPDVRSRTSPTAGFIAAYEHSVHGAALERGNSRVANCVDCHGIHEMQKGIESTSRVNKRNIPETCGRCHGDIAREFAESIHGVELARGNNDAPACTNCHGEHTILGPSDPRSRVAAANVSAQVCSPCHSSVRLSEKYGISSDRFRTYQDSYHGLAMRGGSVEVANCASCHSAHNIKPPGDSTSTVNKANLAVTCGRCHPGANQRFAIGPVHVAMTAKEEPLLYWIANAYIVIIIVTIGGMAFHNILDFVKKSKRTLKIRRGLLPEDYHGHALYVRMTMNERVQHAVLFTSFTILVITGFMLRFPDAWWVRGIRSLSDNVFDLRSWIHRIAGTFMVAVSFYHVYYVAFTHRGRELFRGMVPTVGDIRDALAVLKYNMGLSSVKPRFGRFSYVEKSEYWALVWGTIVMAATGFIMWFDNTFIGLLTKLGYDVSRMIHYYEAWLATLAIIVWHFYYVIFNPDAYPLNLAFWKGTLTETEMAEEHPLELDRIKQQEPFEKIPGQDEQAPTSGKKPQT